MDDVIEIKVDPRPARTLTFRIGDEDYAFRVPKSHGLMSAVRGMKLGTGGAAEVEMYHQIEDWLFAACDDADRLRERLADSDDPLDTEHIVEVFQQVVKAASSRPSP